VSEDYFETLGLPRTLTLTPELLTQRYRELSWAWHPDRRSRDEQTTAMEQTARLNAAYRTLRDPFARAQHLLMLENVPPLTTPPADFLMAVFELQELLEEDTTPLATLQTQQDTWQTHASAMLATLEQAFQQWDTGDRQALTTLQTLLVQYTYTTSLLAKLGDALS
jgi:molecular chaperone HscB